MKSDPKMDDFKLEISILLNTLISEFHDESSEHSLTLINDLKKYLETEKFYLSINQRNSKKSYLKTLKNSVLNILYYHHQILNEHGLYPNYFIDNMKYDLEGLGTSIKIISKDEVWSFNEWGKTKSFIIENLINNIKLYRKSISENSFLLSSLSGIDFIISESKFCYLVLEKSHEIISRRNVKYYSNNHFEEYIPDKITAHFLKSNTFKTCKYCYRVANNSELCSKHQTSIVDSNKENRLGERVFKSLTEDELALLNKYKAHRNIVQHDKFCLHSKFIIEEIPDSKTCSLPTNYYTHSIVYSMQNEDWKSIVLPKLLQLISRFSCLPIGLSNAISSTTSLKDLVRLLYSENFLNNQYEASEHPYWLLNAIALESMLMNRERVITKHRISERNERWLYKHTVQKMSYNKVLQSEREEGNEDVSLSNIKKVVGQMLKERRKSS